MKKYLNYQRMLLSYKSMCVCRYIKII